MTRERLHTTGDENSSPGRVKEASFCPSSPSRIHTAPSVDATATRVPVLPATEPSNTHGLEYTFPVVWKVQTKEPSAQFRQYSRPSCDPHRTLCWSGVTHGEEKTGPFVKNCQTCREEKRHTLKYDSFLKYLWLSLVVATEGAVFGLPKFYSRQKHDSCGSDVEPASCHWKVAGSITLVCMSKCPWAGY